MNDQACLEGLDETGFVMGTSSNLFNVRFIISLDESMFNTTFGYSKSSTSAGRN